MADLPPFGKNQVSRIFKVLTFLVFFFIACVLSINVYVYSQTREFIFSLNSPATSTVNSVLPRAEVIILLGASVFKNGDLTPVLGDRADTAIDLYTSGFGAKILVTGDNSTKYYNEVTPTRNYLLKHGVAEADILVDNGGIDTFQSMTHAKGDFDVRSALIVSQRFHLARAVYIARKLGIEAYGIAADHRSYSLKNDFRELFATVKSIGEVNSK